jgi:Bax protein
LRDGFLLTLLGSVTVGLIALVSSGHPLPRLASQQTQVSSVAHGSVPPATYAIRLSETRNAGQLQAAFDRIGFDLDSVAAGYISVPRVLLASLPEDLDSIDAPDARKALFLRALLPVVLEVNDQIGRERARLLDVRRQVKAGQTLSDDDVRWVMSLADSYDEPEANLDALVRKVDVIPPSLTLAQAIEESGWGTSRIARQQNALFGQFGQDESGQWDYRDFSTLTEAVQAYAHNLNTHRAYKEYRQARSQMRRTQGELDSYSLASTLHRYSERGDEYVQELRSIMRANGLEAFDAARLNVRSVATIVASNQVVVHPQP